MKLTATPALALALACLCPAGARADGPALTAGATASWEQNITRCPDPAGAKDAALYDATGAAAWRTQVSRDVSLQFDTSAGLESCPKFDGLDRILLGIQGAVRRKFGLGPFAPVVQADLSCTGSWYRESLRSGARVAASLSASRRWSDDWQTVVTVDVMHNAGRGAAYNYRNGGLAIETRYDLSDRWQLSAGVRRQWGEQVTYAWIGGSGANFPYDYATWKNTTAITTYGPNWQAYTIDAHADSVWFALSPALGENRALPLKFEETAVVGHGESYRVRLVSLGFVQRF